LLKSKFIWNEAEQTSAELVSDFHPEIERLFLKRQLGSINALTTKELADEVKHDPFKFKDMQSAVTRIKDAIANCEKILVYGDYDADGTTAVAIVMRALRILGAKADFYIPNRFFEGYGPNPDAFLQAVSDGYQLVITVDCGISAIAEAQLLADNQVDLIITDHHQPQAEMPKAVAIIHPEVDPNYPFDYLAGAGVALKVAEALGEGNLTADDYMLAMFGTIGDVVNLVDENRQIVKQGLAALKQTTLPGVVALLKEAKLNQYEVDEKGVSFAICPRLNAPGRMDDASIVVELFLAKDATSATEYAQAIEALNKERKTVTTKITTDAIKLAKAKESNQLKALVLYQPDWHEGVLGIVAAKLTTKYGVVAVVLTNADDGLIKGSARAPAGVDILAAMQANANLLEKYGGHASAVGLSLLNVNQVEALEIALNQTLEHSEPFTQLAVDLQLEPQEIDFKLIADINFLAPFGQANQRPLVKLSAVQIKDVKRIGANYEHLKFTIAKDATQLEAIFFNGAKTFVYLTAKTTFDLLCEVEINEWHGNKKIQARIIDMKCDEPQVIDLRNPQLADEFAQLVTDGFVVDCAFDSKAMLKSAFIASGSKNVILKKQPTLTMPSREQFALVYQAVKAHAPFYLTPEIMAYFNQGGVSQAMLTFIVKVLLEVELCSYEANVLRLKAVNTKVDFKASPSYQARAAKVLVNEFLELYEAPEILKFMVGG